MYRVTETRDKTKPSVVLYQGEEYPKAFKAFQEACSIEEITECVLCLWIVDNTKRRGEWKTRFLFKHYR